MVWFGGSCQEFDHLTVIAPRQSKDTWLKTDASTNVSTNLPARWDGIAGTHEARIEDLGMGGCFVNTTGRVGVGELVGLEIKLPSGKWLELRGEVTAYQTGIGFGVLFTFLTDDEQQALREIVS